MIVNRQRAVRVSLKTMEDFFQRVRRELRLPKDSLTVCLISNAEMAKLNRKYRKKNGSTDVLSFPAEPGNGARPRGTKTEAARAREKYVGDIAISPAIAKRNASRYGRTLNDELKILLLHGALHLLGYDHETDNGEMERVEGRLRRQLEIA